jgi:hypothetical protein
LRASDHREVAINGPIMQDDNCHPADAALVDPTLLLKAGRCSGYRLVRP